MVDRPIDRVERPRDEGLYAARIGEDKKEKQKYSELPPDKQSKKVLVASFFAYLKKMFDSFSPSKQLAGKVVDVQAAVEHLKSFKSALEKLREQNLSNSPEYATELSDIWTLLMEDFDNLAIIQRKALDKTAAFRQLIDAVKNYPPNSEHRLGYYLLQHAGKDWLPFPFIELLKELHQNHIAQTSHQGVRKDDETEAPQLGEKSGLEDNQSGEPDESTLTQWLSLIDQVIESLGHGLPFGPDFSPRREES